jgi:hypothetical protein
MLAADEIGERGAQAADAFEVNRCRMGECGVGVVENAGFESRGDVHGRIVVAEARTALGEPVWRGWRRKNRAMAG